ncbi:MAG: hypothetical protein J0G96_04800 [Flavobacteriia bacterium]|nr:hypothetical protein [Flavobacteriia bacterium]OJX35343.1 MAG: hypothetical protein BGO87_12110 [Flavobacteriia bacterium 40-80]
MKTKLILALLVVSPLLGFGQKFKILSGSFEPLKGETEFNVQMDYSQVKFYKENMTEKQYIDKRKKEITADKGAAEADKWLSDWERTKSVQIVDKVVAVTNKHNGKDHKYSAEGDAKYTLVVRPQWVDPGWFGGAVKKPSQLNVIFDFVETANPSKVIVSVNCTGAIGDMYPMGIANTNDRIAEAFGQGSAAFVKFVKKNLK